MSNFTQLWQSLSVSGAHISLGQFANQNQHALSQNVPVRVYFSHHRADAIVAARRLRVHFTFFNEKARVRASSGFLHSNLRPGRKSELGHPRGNCAYSSASLPNSQGRRLTDALSLWQRAAKKVSSFLQFVSSRFTSTCNSRFSLRTSLLIAVRWSKQESRPS